MSELLLSALAYAIAVLGGGRFVQCSLERALSKDDLKTIDAFRASGLSDGGN